MTFTNLQNTFCLFVKQREHADNMLMARILHQPRAAGKRDGKPNISVHDVKASSLFAVTTRMQQQSVLADVRLSARECRSQSRS